MIFTKEKCVKSVQSLKLKKTWLAIACASALAPAANAVEVYKDGATSVHVGGRLFALYQKYDEYQHKGDGSHNWDGKGTWTNNNARINLSGEHQLNGDLKVMAFWEREFNSEENRDEQRAMFVAMESKTWGRVQFGREENVLWNVRTMADIVQESIFDGRRIVGALDGGDHWWNANTLAYKVWKDKFDFSAAYALPDGDDKQDTSSFNFSGKYKTDFGLDIGIGYVYGKQDDYDSNSGSYVNKEDQQQYWIGAQYRIDNFTFGAVTSYAVIEDDTKGKDDRWLDHELAVAYNWNKFKVGVVYAQRNTDKKGTDNFRGFTGEFTEVDAFNYGVSYKVFDKLSIFGVVAKNDSDTSNDTKWHLGTEYYF